MKSISIITALFMTVLSFYFNSAQGQSDKEREQLDLLINHTTDSPRPERLYPRPIKAMSSQYESNKTIKQFKSNPMLYVLDMEKMAKTSYGPYIIDKPLQFENGTIKGSIDYISGGKLWASVNFYLCPSPEVAMQTFEEKIAMAYSNNSSIEKYILPLVKGGDWAYHDNRSGVSYMLRRNVFVTAQNFLNDIEEIDNQILKQIEDEQQERAEAVKKGEEWNKPLKIVLPEKTKEEKKDSPEIKKEVKPVESNKAEIIDETKQKGTGDEKKPDSKPKVEKKSAEKTAASEGDSTMFIIIGVIAGFLLFVLVGYFFIKKK